VARCYPRSRSRFPIVQTLYQHQQVGADWLLARRRAGLFDEPGLGKTATAVAAAESVLAAEPGARALVLAPTVVALNWAREWCAWSGRHARDVLVVPTSRHASYVGLAPVTVVPHSLLIRPEVRLAVLRRRWAACVLDEAHAFRSPSAKRSVAFFGVPRGEDQPARLRESVLERCDRAWFLTGTPIVNDVTDLWLMLASAFPERLAAPGTPAPSLLAFARRYCHVRPSQYDPGWKVVANRQEAMPELRKRLDGLFLRRTKAECLDLPEVSYEDVQLAWDAPPSELLELEASVGRKVMAAVEAAGDDPAGELRALRDGVDVARFRRLCGLCKVGPVAELAALDLDGGEPKVVVFAHHADVVAGIAQRLAPYGVVTITGATPGPERQAAVDRFQLDPRVRVAVLNIVAGGVGVTLTAAALAIFAELSWVPGENAQAADRIHRIGQGRRCRVRFCSLARTADVDVSRALRAKVRMIREVLR